MFPRSRSKTCLHFTILKKNNSRFEVIRVLSELRKKRSEEMNPKTLFPKIQEFAFRPEIKVCSRCGTKINVLKTEKRTVVTMGTGTFVARETHLHCPHCREIGRSQDLRKLVPFKCTYGYDVLVHVGKSLYIRSINEQAVAKELKSMAIDISENEIRYLGQKFIAYLSICHGQSQLKMRLAMARKGGYILHIDGTCEGDSPHLFTGMDEISGIILSSVKINSEKKKKIVPFLKNIQVKYGTPLAVVSDMGKGLLAAIEDVFPDIPSLICHFHFLRDIGKDLLDDDYRTLRNGLTKSKIRTALKSKAKDFERKLGKHMQDLANIDADPEYASVKTALLLIYWIFDRSSLSGYGFPFDMQHFIFYKRLVAGYKKVDKLHGQKESKAFYQLKKLLRRIVEDEGFEQTASILGKNEIVFNELREALRIAMPEGKNGLNDDGSDCDMKSISVKVSEFIDKYDSSTEKVHRKMIEQISKYHEKLFADPIPSKVDCDEILIQPQRTNNVMERLFRDLKRLLRRKSGSISLKRPIGAMLPDTVLVKNLENEEYLKMLLQGTSGLEERFAQIDSHLFIREFAKMRSHSKKIPTDAKKLIKEDHALEKIENLFFAVAN